MSDLVEKANKNIEMGGYLDGIISREETNDHIIELVAEVKRLRAEGRPLAGYRHIRTAQEKIESLTKERDELNDDLQAEKMDCADTKKRLIASEKKVEELTPKKPIKLFRIPGWME